MVDVQNVRRDTSIARARLFFSIASVIGVPWLLTLGQMPGLAALSVLPTIGFYLWSAQSLAATDRGAGERSFVHARLKRAGDTLVVASDKGSKTFPLSQLSGGWVERAERQYAAVLTFSDGNLVVVERPTEIKASDLLRSLGAGTQSSAVRMRGYIENAQGRKLAGCLLALLAPIALAVALAIPVLLIAALLTGSSEPARAALFTGGGGSAFLLMSAWLWSKVRPTWLHIGADGVVVPGLLRNRFIPHAEITSASTTRGGVGNAYNYVQIYLQKGNFVVVPAANMDEAAAIVHRILTAKHESRGQERARLLDVLARNERPIAEWKRALSGLVTKSGYRTAGRDVEEVLRIVEDPRAPAAQRVAAALAARPHEDATVKERIRVAALASVEPKLRVTLEKASSGDVEDAELEALASEPLAKDA